MADLAPREMRRAWTAAFGNARLAGRDAVEPGDLPAATRQARADRLREPLILK